MYICSVSWGADCHLSGHHTPETEIWKHKSDNQKPFFTITDPIKMLLTVTWFIVPLIHGSPTQNYQANQDAMPKANLNVLFSMLTDHSYRLLPRQETSMETPKMTTWNQTIHQLLTPMNWGAAGRFLTPGQSESHHRIHKYRTRLCQSNILTYR